MNVDTDSAWADALLWGRDSGTLREQLILIPLLIRPCFRLAGASECKDPLFAGRLLVPVERIELPTFGLQKRALAITAAHLAEH
jgi:hypothetical protein